MSCNSIYNWNVSTSFLCISAPVGAVVDVAWTWLYSTSHYVIIIIIRVTLINVYYIGGYRLHARTAEIDSTLRARMLVVYIAECNLIT